jgi:hypothetical protein
MEGRATLTMDESKAFINMARHTTIRAIQRVRFVVPDERVEEIDIDEILRK